MMINASSSFYSHPETNQPMPLAAANGMPPSYSHVFQRIIRENVAAGGY